MLHVVAFFYAFNKLLERSDTTVLLNIRGALLDDELNVLVGKISVVGKSVETGCSHSAQSIMNEKTSDSRQGPRLSLGPGATKGCALSIRLSDIWNEYIFEVPTGDDFQRSVGRERRDRDLDEFLSVAVEACHRVCLSSQESGSCEEKSRGDCQHLVVRL